MIRLPLIVLLSSLAVLSSAPVRGACTDGPEVCVDGPGSKFINGVEVWRECWNYQTTRHCTSSSTVDYCSGNDGADFVCKSKRNKKTKCKV